MKRVAGICVLALAMSAGCGDSSETGESASSGNSIPEVALIPASLFEGGAPAEFVSLQYAKQGSAVGERVSFQARIGGRVEPFVAERAVMLVTDSSLESCAELHGDSCPTPWDYCCEPRDSLTANSATVQVVGEDGRPLKAALKGVGGLDPLATVIVVGTVAQKDDSGTFVVNADRLYVAN